MSASTHALIGLYKTALFVVVASCFRETTHDICRAIKLPYDRRHPEENGTANDDVSDCQSSSPRRANALCACRPSVRSVCF